MSASTANPTHELVVFGATSFVGQLLCRYLSERYKDDNTLTWAIAGRNRSRLESLRGELGEPELPLIVADATDPTSLHALCESTRVVISTVGPYALYGEPMIAACTETGTDYCDLTGEMQWIRRMIGKYENTAQASGARIVHCCGFDSLPSDLGVFLVQQEAQERFMQPCTRVKMRVKALRGSFSGGTVASLMNVAREVAQDPELRRELADPYSICPDDYRPDMRQPGVRFAAYDPDMDSWIAPFIMAAINTRVVQRSNALSRRAYGAEFQYDEAMMTGRGIKGRLAAGGLAVGLGGFMLGAAIKPARWALERFVVPEPGRGPSPEAQANGFYDLRFYGETADGHKLRARVTGDRDPGYGSTSRMLGEAGACLALDVDKADPPGGFWTPATIFGERLIERLQQHAGVTFGIMNGPGCRMIRTQSISRQ